MPALYCLDSSSIIAAWDERYPPENFPPFWNHMDAAITAGQLFVAEAVIDELEKKSKDAAAWLKQRPTSIVPYTTSIQQQAKAILATFPRLVMAKKIAFAADPFVIATAKVNGYVVVSEEGPGSVGKPTIPDVCRAYGVDCMKLLGVIRQEAWIIG